MCCTCHGFEQPSDVWRDADGRLVRVSSEDQALTPETVYSPTMAAGYFKGKEPYYPFIYLARAGFEPTAFSTIGSGHTTTLSMQATLSRQALSTE